MSQISNSTDMAADTHKGGALALCQNQVLAFYRDLDENRYQDLANRFAPDGVWHRQGKVLAGRQAVLDALASRSTTQRIHHLIVNLLADQLDDGRCLMRAYMLVVRHDSGKALQGPAPLTGIENIRTLHMELAYIDGAWLIRQMRGEDISFAMSATGVV